MGLVDSNGDTGGSMKSFGNLIGAVVLFVSIAVVLAGAALLAGLLVGIGAEAYEWVRS